MDMGKIGIMMVGEWFASSVMQKLVDDWYDSFTGAKTMVEDVKARLPRIRAVIQAAEGRPIRDPALATWLRELKDAAYEADDVLDELEFKELHDKLHGKSKVSDLASYAVKLVKHFILSDDDLTKLKKLVGNLDNIYIDINYKEEQLKDYKSQQKSATRETSSVIQDIVFGRDKERDMILNVLLYLADEPESSNTCGIGSSSYPSLGVLPIVGIGGVGKTALAQLVYNDDRVVNHFELRKWVYVSDNFDVKRISQELIYGSGYDRIVEGISLERILGQLRDATRNKRFLFVLDDAWDETGSKWRELCGVLTSGAEGSMVLVTTQSTIVAEIMGTMDPIELKSLPEDDYWRLFEYCAFGQKILEEKRKQKLQTIGKKISKKLHGLPLAGKVLGSLLKSKLDDDYWQMILESEWWEHEYVLDNILPSLALSYEHLNANLKQCFAYCSIFPKSYVFEKDRLVQMWMAQGFIPNKYSMRMEDIGVRIFDELTSRYFFLTTPDNRYVMHDLIRELAVYVSLDECLIISDEKGEMPQTIRHLTLRTDNIDAFMDTCRLQNLRSILFFGDYNYEKFYSFFDSMLKQSKSLRVLDLSCGNVKLENLPDAISGLSHLRYLDVSCTGIKQLPKLFGRLCHLQVLSMRSCYLKRLPEDMNKLINLRYLYGEADTISLITGIGDLTNLQELDVFRVTRKRRHEIGELKGLRNLRRRLSIQNLENVNSKEEAMEAMLKDKEHLTALHLVNNFINGPDAEREILEGLQPHPGLKELSIEGYGGIRFPTWMVESNFLINLELINLEYCDRLESVPPLGQLPYLKELCFSNMPAVKRIGREFYGDSCVPFPSLEVLSFNDMNEWEEWLEADGIEFLPRLRTFHLRRCFRLKKVPLLFLSSLTDLMIRDCSAQVSLYLSNLSALKRLELLGCPKMKLVKRCPKLIESSEPVQLHEEQGLQTLNHLRIDGMILLQNLGILFGSLPSLRFMHIDDKIYHGIYSPTNFTGEQELWFRQLTSLRELEISCCRNLESLPTSLVKFSTITKLSISHCPNVRSLPENGLATSLKELHIELCPLLKDRCQRGGADWPKIAHIPFIRIHRKTIQML